MMLKVHCYIETLGSERKFSQANLCKMNSQKYNKLALSKRHDNFSPFPSINLLILKFKYFFTILPEPGKKGIVGIERKKELKVWAFSYPALNHADQGRRGHRY